LLLAELVLELIEDLLDLATRPVELGDPGRRQVKRPLGAQAHLFEREIWEQHQVEPVGHPWLQPVDVPVRSVFSGTE